MSIDLSSIAAPATPGKEAGSGFLTIIILAIVGILAYKLFFSNSSTVNEKK